MSKFQKIAYVGAVGLMLALPLMSFAAVNIPTPPVTGSGLSLSDFQTLIEQVANFLIVVSLVIAVVFILIGGVMWMAAQGDEEKAKTARTRIKNGVIGAAIVLGVGIILQTVARLVSNIGSKSLY